MVYNKLISRRRRAEMPPGTEITEVRASGRSTGLAYFYIGIAMKNPGSWINIVDHYDADAPHSANRNSTLLDLVTQIIEREELYFFEISPGGCRIKYKVFTENQWEVE